MAGSVQQFWQMVVRSGLHDEAACREFADAYFQAKESGKSAGQSLPEWLVASKALTRYQAKILIAGRPGPFVFEEYVVNDRIETGPHAGQFRATHRATGCPVTLRFLSGPPAADTALMASLTEQTIVMAALSRDTTRLAHCYALVDSGVYKFFVLEALAGESLADRLAKPGGVAPAGAVRIIAQVATGLARLHRAGRAHGEISPASIWISPNGAKSSVAKLLGFPWAPDPLGPNAAGAATAANFRPPERTAQTPATPSGDVYALGCTLYQLLARKPAFQPVDLATPLEKIAAGVTPQLAGLVARMVAKNPADRIPDAALLAKELASIEGGQVAASAPSALRVGLDASIAAQRSQSASAVGAAHPQLTPVTATPAEAATAPVEVFAARAKTPVVAAAQPAGVASLADLVDHDEPVSAASAKPRAVAATGEKRKNLPLIVAGASTIVVLIAVALLVLSRGFGGGAAPQTAQTSPPKPTPVVVAETDGGDGPMLPAATEPSDPAADPQAPVEPLPGADPAQTAGAETKAPGAPESPGTGRPGDPLVGVSGEMWASPTAGKPLDLAYLPPGAEVIVALRVADFARHAEAQRLLDPRTSGALGTWISEQLPALAGAPLEGVDQALIALLPTPDGAPRLAIVAQLKEASAEDALLKSWGNPQPKESDGAKYFQKGDMAYYIPAAGAGRTIVVAPAALLVEDILPNGVNPPALRREMELLLSASDADRLVTLLAAPNILLTGGDEWLPGAAARARSPLDWFLAGEAEDRAAAPTPSGKAARRGPMTDLSSSGLPKGVLASAHLTDADLFLEVRLLADPNQPPKRLAEGYQERVARLSRRTSDFLRTLAMSDYSRDVLFEFPLMVEQLAKFTVAGTEGRQVVLRSYLPAQAAHNLALGGHLAILETPRAGGAAGPTQTAGAPTKAPIGSPGGTTPTEPGAEGPIPNKPGSSETTPAGTVAERLDRKMSLNFDRNTLEPTLKQIGQEIGVEVVIMGADLQNEGITRNKAINKFAERDLPAREILHKIMEKANPDGKLIYVIKPAQSGEGEALYFTTRAAAAARGDKLPAEFEK